MQSQLETFLSQTRLACRQVSQVAREKGVTSMAFREALTNAAPLIFNKCPTKAQDCMNLLNIPEISDLQDSDTFSDLNIKLYRDSYLRADLLNWYGTDLMIHDHKFSGAQYQLKGRSLNVRYSHDAMDDVSAQMVRTNIKIVGCEVWHEGQTFPIEAGARESHSVIHLDWPTVSMVIGSTAKNSRSQKNYFPPFVRASFEVVKHALMAQMKLMKFAYVNDRGRFFELFESLLGVLSKTQGFFLVLDLCTRVSYQDFLSCLNIYGKRFPELLGVKESLLRHSYSLFFVRTLRDADLSFDCRLVLAAMSSSYDSESFAFIVNELNISPRDCNQVLQKLKSHSKSEAELNDALQFLAMAT